MNNRDKTGLAQGSVGKLLFNLAMPAIIAQVINLLYNVVDRMYIGRIEGVGADALTGVGVTMPIILLITAFVSLVSRGGAPRAAIHMGKGEYDVAEKIVGNCMSMLIIAGISLTAVTLTFGQQLLMMFGASENTVQYAWEYLSIYAIGTISVQFSLGLNPFITTQGFAKRSMATVLIGAICNIILDPIFIFALDMGVAGAALATIISQTVSAVWVVWFLVGKKTILRLKLKNLRLSRAIVVPCLALGVSPFIMTFTESILSVSFNTSLLRYGGDIAVGAMTILSSSMQFCMLPLNGLTQGSQPIISYNYGAGNYDRVRSAFKITLISCLAFSAALWSVCMFFPQVLIGLFTNEPALVEYASTAMRIYMASSLMFGAQIACQNTFLALGKAKASAFLALLRKVVLLIPLIFILPNFMERQDLAVFLAEPIADAIAVISTCTLFAYSFKRILSENMAKVENT